MGRVLVRTISRRLRVCLREATSEPAVRLPEAEIRLLLDESDRLALDAEVDGGAATGEVAPAAMAVESDEEDTECSSLRVEALSCDSSCHCLRRFSRQVSPPEPEPRSHS